MIGAFLVILVGLCFYAGYKFALQRAIEQTLMVLEDDDIIRLVNKPNGEIEVYSGTKFYNGVEKWTSSC